MFCGSNIKVFKHTKNTIKNKIIVSTCYFVDYQNYIDLKDGKQIIYLHNLIANIETFDFKIKKYTSNPEKWIYRVHIDESIFHLQEYFDKIIGDYHGVVKDLRDKSNNEVINELDDRFIHLRTNIMQNYNMIIFLQKLLIKYLNKILKSSESKYDNIEILTYNNPNMVLRTSANNEQISGMIHTYGTLLRYYALLDKDADIVIMRNCSFIFSPLDILIQNYWIENVKDKEYMEYTLPTYSFNGTLSGKFIKTWYDIFYNSSSNTKTEKRNKIIHFLNDRIFAGAIACRINGNFHDYKHYENVFAKLYNKIQINLSSNSNINVFNLLNKEKIFYYGIDEVIINFIFPDLRSGTYNFNEITNPLGLEQKTFAVKIDRVSNNMCNECDKKTFLKKLYESHKTIKRSQKHKISLSLKGGSSYKKTHTSNKDKKDNKNKCCLRDILEFDIEHFNLPHDLEKTYNYGYNRALPFQKLNINTWKVSNLSLEILLKNSILFNNYYRLALKDKFIIPTYVKEYKKIIDKGKTRILYDKYLIICDVRSKNIDKEINKYFDVIKKVYDIKNYNPILLYPENLTILEYYNTYNLPITKILEPVKNNHGFIFDK